MQKHYDKLTPRERFLALLAAEARGDETEYGRLTESAPRHTYTMRDAAVSDLLEATRELALIFMVLWHEALRDYTLGLFAAARNAAMWTASRKGKAGDKAWREWLTRDEQRDDLQSRGLCRLLGLVSAWDAFCREFGLPGDTILQARVGPASGEVTALRASLLDGLIANAEGLSATPEVREVAADCLHAFRRHWPEAIE